MNIGRNTLKQVVIGTLAALGLLIVLSGCSGIIGGQTVVHMTLGNGGSGRYIDENTQSGYVAVFRQDRVYSINEFEGTKTEFENGSVYLNSLAPGDYVFVVALTGEESGTTYNSGLAIKEVTVERGLNNVLIDVGPGVSSFGIEELPPGGGGYPVLRPLDDFMEPGRSYSVGFADNTLILRKSDFNLALPINFYNVISLTFRTDMNSHDPVLIGNDTMRFFAEENTGLGIDVQEYFLQIQLID